MKHFSPNQRLAHYLNQSHTFSGEISIFTWIYQNISALPRPPTRRITPSKQHHRSVVCIRPRSVSQGIYCHWSLQSLVAPVPGLSLVSADWAVLTEDTSHRQDQLSSVFCIGALIAHMLRWDWAWAWSGGGWYLLLDTRCSSLSWIRNFPENIPGTFYDSRRTVLCCSMIHENLLKIVWSIGLLICSNIGTVALQKGREGVIELRWGRTIIL